MWKIAKGCKYVYTNDIGRSKTIIVFKGEVMDYDINIWDNATGEFCGIKEMTKKQLQEYFEHYGIKENIPFFI